MTTTLRPNLLRLSKHRTQPGVSCIFLRGQILLSADRRASLRCRAHEVKGTQTSILGDIVSEVGLHILTVKGIGLFLL